MRVAVIADIHGNLLALEAVLADLKGRGADLVVDLGDCASGPLWPRETMERLHGLEALTVRGNHDRQVAELAPAEMGPSDRFAFGELTKEQRLLLGELPMTRFIAPGIFACHATPARDDLYLIDEVENGGLARGNPDAISKRLGTIEAKVVLCGHSHRADLVRLSNGSMVLNPGSVGSPAYDDEGPPAHVSESGTPCARYALLEENPKSGVTVEFIAVAYAFEKAARRAQENGRNEWAHALRTGFMPRLR
ncbi:MAG: metallophosphoesterase family protein [Hyphomicrobiales bacterium]|nr:metallophosphoesterase family protein [Hyphomicrobiales bacterium]MBV9114436.1 metallophosphoesterase family protein [Hyphomicrobiales bacterium]MBV9519882.1 metallophosphoesterase family protein [Hyphomicrobiales bacterium]